MLIPATRYHDCEAALAFLTDVLGLTPFAVFRDDDGRIMHAQMTLGAGIMMFGPPNDGAFDGFMAAPADAGGVTTSIYGIVQDVAGLHTRVTGAGAEIVMPLAEQPYGGSSFSVRDPEGHIWTFGDYDPKAGA